MALTKANIIPFGDGLRAWVLDQDGISIVDAKGIRTPERGAWMQLGTQNSELVQTRQPGRAWVLAHAPGMGSSRGQERLYLVDIHQAPPGGAKDLLRADQFVHMREQPSVSPYDLHPELPLYVDWDAHSHLWLVTSINGIRTLFSFDAEGNRVLQLPLKALGSPVEADAEGWQVVPTRDGAKAWLKTEGQLFFLEPGSPARVRGPFMRGARILQVVPDSDGSRAWVMAEVRSQTDSRLTKRLYQVDARAPSPNIPDPFLKGLEVRQIVPSADGNRLWVAGAMRSELGGGGGVYLIDIKGRPQRLPEESWFSGTKVLLAATRSGLVWVITRTGGAYLLDGDGKVIARGEGVVPLPGTSEKAFDEVSTSPLGSGNGLLFWAHHVVHLRPEGGKVQVRPLLGGAEIRSLDVEPTGQGAWVQSNKDGNIYFISLADEHYLEQHFVVTAPRAWSVFPAGDARHAWIQAMPASYACVPLDSVGASLKLEGGSLRIEHGRQAAVQGRLSVQAPLDGDDADSVDLDWPGRAHAAETGGVLEVTLQDPDHPETPVATITRRYAQGASLPRINWFLRAPSFSGRTYDITFRYHDDFGTNTRLVVRRVHFHASLVEQLWFRTAVACLVATLLFIAPMVLLPRTRLARRWLPLVSWLVNMLGGSGLTVSGAAHHVRIHVPTFVGVLLAEMILCLVAGAFSPTMFRLLASTKPFQWLVPLALELPATRRRIFGDYVTHVRRKLEAWRHQANDERFVSIPVDFDAAGASLSTGKGLEPVERIFHLLSHPDWTQRGNVLIESPGGRGKSALLREVVRRMLIGFEEKPSRPLPVLCDFASSTLEEAAYRALEVNPLPHEVHEALLLSGDYVLVIDGLTESSLTPEVLRSFVEGRLGTSVRLLLTSRPHLGFRHAIESSERWLHVEPRRLDEQTLGHFIAAYVPDGAGTLSEELAPACQGPDRTYLPILVRLALLFGEGPGSYGMAELYEAAFRGLLRRRGEIAAEEDTELLAWAGDFCLRTYWVNGIRSIRYRNSPEQAQLQKLLKAGVLVPDEPNLKPGQEPAQVRFFHDSMQSYLAARGLFAREHAAPTWDILWRAAADPMFVTAQSELISSTGSELFQMCLQVFGPEERLSRELQRQLLEWALIHDGDLTKRDITSAVLEALRSHFLAAIFSSAELSPGSVLRIAIQECSGHLVNLGTLYMRIANLLWPFREKSSGHPPSPAELSMH